MRECDYSKNEFGCKCRNSKATKIARVKYSKNEEDALYLCDKCVDDLQKESSSHGWKLTVRDLSGVVR